jgi:hypothetical protein
LLPNLFSQSLHDVQHGLCLIDLQAVRDFSGSPAISIKSFTVVLFPAMLLLLFYHMGASCCFGFVCASLYTTGCPYGSFDFFINARKIQVLIKYCFP